MLEVKDLSIYFTDRGKREDAVRHVSFSMEAGEILGIVGESGSGKDADSPDHCWTSEEKCDRGIGRNPVKENQSSGIEYETVAADPGEKDWHDFSGTDDCTESHHEDRTTSRRRVEASLRLFEGRTKTEGVTGSGKR